MGGQEVTTMPMSPEREALERSIARVKALAEGVLSAANASADASIEIDLDAFATSFETVKANRLPRFPHLRGLVAAETKRP
jgi:hypothetical protein